MATFRPLLFAHGCSCSHAVMLYGQVASLDAKYRPMYATLLNETQEQSPDWLQVLRQAGF